MATDVSDLVGAENMSREKLSDVITVIHALQTTDDTKKYILLRWGREVNCQIGVSDLVKLVTP